MMIKLTLGAVTAALLLLSGCTASNNNMSTNSQVSHLSDKNSMALYTFDKDTMNKSNCYNGCEAKWPVFYGDLDKLNLPKGTSKSDFGTITRKDGTMQTTYKMKPLYYFFMDKKSNEIKGDGKKGVWHIVK